MAFPKKECQPTWFITVSYRTPHDILPYIPADFDILILQLCHTVTEHVLHGNYHSIHRPIYLTISRAKLHNTGLLQDMLPID